MTADQDNASGRTILNRRRKDLLFLEGLRWTRYYEDIEMLWRLALQHRRGPKWRQVAIVRTAEDISRGGARERLLATTEEDDERTAPPISEGGKP